MLRNNCWLRFAMFAAFVAFAGGQTRAQAGEKAMGTPQAAVPRPASRFAPTQVGAETSSQVFREIDDPHYGFRWVLLRNRLHPAGPGCMILASGEAFTVGLSNSKTSRDSRLVKTHKYQTLSLPIIRAGDRLIVEEHSAIVDARLEAVALGPGATGSTIRVRLKVGGKVARAIAVAPGQGTLLPSAEEQR